EAILGSEKKLYQKIKKELRQIKKTYSDKRRTAIENQIEELMINIDVTVASEDVLVSITKEGYVKRTSLRSYAASNGEDLAMKDDDHLVRLIELNTTDKVLLFINLGMYLFIPEYEIQFCGLKCDGMHV